MATPPIKNVVLLGADGKLGPTIYQHLVDNAFNVTVLKRQSSKSPSVYPKQAFVSDAFAVSELVPILKGQDAMVVTIKGSETALQKRLADACIAAGVRRFIPADFGSVDSSSPLTQRLVPLYIHKSELREYLISLAAANPNFTWTSLVCGHFFDWSLEFLHIYLSSRRAEIINSGTEKWSASTLAQISLATVRILQRPETTANRMLYIQSFLTTQMDVIRAFESATGSKWDVKAFEGKEYEKTEKAKAEAGDLEAVENLVWYLGAVDADWTGREDFAMQELGLEEESMEEVVRRVVQEQDGKGK